jgi:hypothetical protein
MSAPASAPGDAAPGTPSRLRNVILVAVPLVLVFGGVGFTYRFYTQHRERYFTERYVRALAALAEQTEAAIDGLDSAFDGAVHEWDKRAQQIETQAALFREQPCPVDADRDDGAPSRQPPAVCALEDFLKPQLELVPCRSATLRRPSAMSRPVRPQARSRAQLAAHPTDHLGHPTGAELGRPASVDTADATLYFCRATPGSVRSTAALANCGWPTNGDWVCAESCSQTCSIRSSSVLRSRTSTSSSWMKGDDALRRGNSGLRLAALRKRPSRPSAARMAAAAAGDTSLEEVVGSTGVRSINVGGTTYALFSQPLRLKARDSSQYTTWAVGALVPQAALDSDAHPMPIAVMASAPLACLLALLALPILRVLTVGSREAFSSSTV